MRRDKRVGLFLAALLLSATGALSGAQGQQLPTQVEPRVNDITSGTFKAPDGSVNIPALRLPDTGAPPGAGEISFTLNDVVIEGVTAYDLGELRGLYADQLGQERTLLEVFGIAAAIESRYRSDGYILSRAIVPAQTVEGGTFKIQVVEGYIDSVTYAGDIGDAKSIIEGYLNNLTAMRPVNIADIERYLLLSNDVPGVVARGVLQPSKEAAGAAQLVVNLERQAIDGFARVDNRASEFTGPWELVGSLGANSYTQFGERLEITGLTSLDFPENRYIGGLAEGRFGSEGFVARGFVGYSNAIPGFTLDPLNVRSDALLVGADAAYPLLRSRQMNFWAKGGFDYTRSNVEVLDQDFIEDRLWVGWIGFEGDYRDRFQGANRVGVTLRQGFDIFDASDSGDPLNSRPDADGSFTSLKIEAARLQRITDGIRLYLGAAYQHAFDPLLSTEEFTLGGIQFGRGYDPAELSNDNGLAGTVEFQFSPGLGLDYVENYHLYAFWDIGQVWSHDSSFDSGQSLASMGFGTRVAVTEWLQVDAEVAVPLTKSLAATQGDDEEAQFFLTVTTRF